MLLAAACTPTAQLAGTHPARYKRESTSHQLSSGACEDLLPSGIFLMVTSRPRRQIKCYFFHILSVFLKQTRRLYFSYTSEGPDKLEKLTSGCTAIVSGSARIKIQGSWNPSPMWPHHVCPPPSLVHKCSPGQFWKGSDLGSTPMWGNPFLIVFVIGVLF